MYSSAHPFVVYLSGEIHSDWRARLTAAVSRADLPVTFVSPVTDHAASDDCGVAILGEEAHTFWKDRKGALINAIRTRSALQAADLVVVRFGETYRQWNAAFEAGQAAAAGTPYVTLHPEPLDHALKEVDAGAQAVCREPEQVAEILGYVIGA